MLRLPEQLPESVRFVLTDVDGTLTTGGALHAHTYSALHELRDAGHSIIPVTGGSAGWADMMARTWPVAAVIAEGGALYIQRLPSGVLRYRFWDDRELQRQRQQGVLQSLVKLLDRYHDMAIARDQDYRLCDVAIDHAQDVSGVDSARVDALVAALRAQGMQASRSSIHINVWLGEHSKGAMAQRLLRCEFGLDIDTMDSQVVCVGDSPNDQDLFARFSNSVGVANILGHWSSLTHRPRWVTEHAEGAGFCELAACLLSKPAAPVSD